MLTITITAESHAGLFMALQPRIIACGTKKATMGMGIRFICGPVLMSAASIAVGLRGFRLHAAIVQACCMFISMHRDVCFCIIRIRK